MEWNWEECDAPEGLDVKTLGQTPFQHGSRWYVKHPETGKVLGAVAINPGMYTNLNLNPFADLSVPKTPPVMATLGAALQQLGADLGALSEKLKPLPPEYQTVVSDAKPVIAAYASLVAYAQNLEKELAAAKAGSKAPTTTSTGSSTGLSKGALAGIVGTGAAIAGFAGGFAAGRMTASHDGKDKAHAAPAARD